MDEDLTVGGKTQKEVAEALGQAAHRTTQLLMWARDQRDVMKESEWTAVEETLEGVVFNLERADLLLRNEARVLLRQAGVTGPGESDAT